MQKKKKKNLAPSIKRWLAQKREGVAETEVSLSRSRLHLLGDAASRPTVPSAGPAFVFTIRFLRPAWGITSSHARAGIPVIMCSVRGPRLQARGDAAARLLAEEVKRCVSPHLSVDTSLGVGGEWCVKSRIADASLSWPFLYSQKRSKVTNQGRNLQLWNGN